MVRIRGSADWRASGDALSKLIPGPKRGGSGNDGLRLCPSGKSFALLVGLLGQRIARASFTKRQSCTVLAGAETCFGSGAIFSS